MQRDTLPVLGVPESWCDCGATGIVWVIADDAKTLDSLFDRAAKSRNQPVSFQDAAQVHLCRIHVAMKWKTRIDTALGIAPVQSIGFADRMPDAFQKMNEVLWSDGHIDTFWYTLRVILKIVPAIGRPAGTALRLVRPTEV